MRPLTVGQLARLAKVGVETIRFYEKSDLLSEPNRSTSGYRTYDETTVRRLTFIKGAKKVGFTLAEIKALLSLRSSGEPCDEVRQQVDAKLTEIAQKIKSLRIMQRELKRLLGSCDARQNKSGCLVLDTLEK